MFLKLMEEFSFRRFAILRSLFEKINVKIISIFERVESKDLSKYEGYFFSRASCLLVSVIF